LAQNGWDTKLCNGGMNWNPRLTPYKNAVTNELWIAASISMYLYYPGDNITSPWRLRPAAVAPRDPKYLAAAVEGYKWLMEVNLTNSQGLFVDGYHVSNLDAGNTKCDQRDEMVYTYNQGVLLTGQRGLWTATGSASYLIDGHTLIQSVIKASGWDIKQGKPIDDLLSLKPGNLPPWHGLGRGGILEDQCDASGTCSQDGQTFKGIFFHHFLAFCATIESVIAEPGMAVNVRALQHVKTAHSTACQGYSGWLAHNAKAAMATRNEDGLFGMWWGAGVFGNVSVSRTDDGIPHTAPNVTDYRNEGIPNDGVWAPRDQNRQWAPREISSTLMADSVFGDAQQKAMGSSSKAPSTPAYQVQKSRRGDPNDRGRGRTVETQSGGLSLLRALWELAYLEDNVKSALE
jgi:Glycosyl hydrolase family 76